MKKLIENWNKYINENEQEQTKPSWLPELEKYVKKAKEFLKLGKPIDSLNWGALAIEIEEDDGWLAHKVKALSGQDAVVSSPEALEEALLDVLEGLEEWNKKFPTEEDTLQRDIDRVASYIDTWFGARAARNTFDREFPVYLRKGAKGEEWDRYSGKVSFTKALSHVAPENVEEFKRLFLKLADATEQNPSLIDRNKIGSQGDPGWHTLAKSL